jgi:LysM repeat protein
MAEGKGRRRSGRAQEWRRARPPVDSDWSLRLRFLSILVVFAFCSWTGWRALNGRVSFAWLAPLQQQAQALTAPFEGASRVAASPPGGNAPVVTVSRQSSAQPVPTAAGVPARAVGSAAPVATVVASTAPVTVLAATPTAVPAAGMLAAATITPATGATPPAIATAAAELAAGPHTIYVVHAGDTLDGIARRFGIAPSTLAGFNHLTPPYRIGAGKNLLIPAA